MQWESPLNLYRSFLIKIFSERRRLSFFPCFVAFSLSWGSLLWMLCLTITFSPLSVWNIWTLVQTKVYLRGAIKLYFNKVQVFFDNWVRFFFRKNSASDLVSRLKTRKVLGVGEIRDDGDIYRSKVLIYHIKEFVTQFFMRINFRLVKSSAPANTFTLKFPKFCIIGKRPMYSCFLDLDF